MCGYLQREVYYANCAEYDLDTLIGSKTIGKDGSVEWRDGIVTQWLRNGGVLFLDEYNFMRLACGSTMPAASTAVSTLVVPLPGS